MSHIGPFQVGFLKGFLYFRTILYHSVPFRTAGELGVGAQDSVLDGTDKGGIGRRAEFFRFPYHSVPFRTVSDCRRVGRWSAGLDPRWNGQGRNRAAGRIFSISVPFCTISYLFVLRFDEPAAYRWGLAGGLPATWYQLTDWTRDASTAKCQ